MIKLIVGTKGSGKTKTLIDLVNTTLDTTDGAVVCIEKGDKLNFAINYRCRLIDTDQYFITDGQSLFGFIAGILASNHDVTDLFIDSALKICQNNIESFDFFLGELEALAEKNEVNFTITASIALEDSTDTMKKFID